MSITRKISSRKSKVGSRKKYGGTIVGMTGSEKLNGGTIDNEVVSQKAAAEAPVNTATDELHFVTLDAAPGDVQKRPKAVEAEEKARKEDDEDEESEEEDDDDGGGGEGGGGEGGGRKGANKNGANSSEINPDNPQDRTTTPMSRSDISQQQKMDQPQNDLLRSMNPENIAKIEEAEKGELLEQAVEEEAEKEREEEEEEAEERAVGVDQATTTAANSDGTDESEPKRSGLSVDSENKKIEKVGTITLKNILDEILSVKNSKLKGIENPNEIENLKKLFQIIQEKYNLKNIQFGGNLNNNEDYEYSSDNNEDYEYSSYDNDDKSDKQGGGGLSISDATKNTLGATYRGTAWAASGVGKGVRALGVPTAGLVGATTGLASGLVSGFIPQHKRRYDKKIFDINKEYIYKLFVELFFLDMFKNTEEEGVRNSKEFYKDYFATENNYNNYCEET